MEQRLIDKLAPYMEDPDFTQEVMSKKSDAAANLCAWVINIYTYNRIYVRVKPLMDALEAARTKKANAQASLDAAQAVVAKVQAALKVLEDSLIQATEEKQAVEVNLLCIHKDCDVSKLLSIQERHHKVLTNKEDETDILTSM